MNLNKNGSVIRLMKKLAKSKLSGITIGKLEQFAAKMGVDEKQLLQLYVDTKTMLPKRSSQPHHIQKESCYCLSVYVHETATQN